VRARVYTRVKYYYILSKISKSIYNKIIYINYKIYKERKYYNK
jgi:hypothetical protein